MKYTDWKYLATIFCIFGIFLLLGGAITCVIPVDPYHYYALPLIIFGVVLIFLSGWRLILVYASKSWIVILQGF